MLQLRRESVRFRHQRDTLVAPVRIQFPESAGHRQAPLGPGAEGVVHFCQESIQMP